MSNNDSPQPDHLAIVDVLTAAEQAAWLKLELAEHELTAARRHVIEVTNRETGKRRMRHGLRIVRDHPPTIPLSSHPTEIRTAQSLPAEAAREPETQERTSQPASQKKPATSGERSA
jgi:hypothetical protein